MRLTLGYLCNNRLKQLQEAVIIKVILYADSKNF